jgi:hypothetical protein
MGTTCSLSKVKDGGGGGDNGCFHGLTEVHRKICALGEGATVLETAETTAADQARVDLSCFTPPRRVLGLGGFGCVRETTKVVGKDKGKRYALKSLAKTAVLARSSGVSSVLSELRALAVLVDAPFICCVHYAFQVMPDFLLLFVAARFVTQRLYPTRFTTSRMTRSFSWCWTWPWAATCASTSR